MKALQIFNPGHGIKQTKIKPLSHRLNKIQINWKLIKKKQKTNKTIKKEISEAFHR